MRERSQFSSPISLGMIAPCTALYTFTLRTWGYSTYMLSLKSCQIKLRITLFRHAHSMTDPLLSQLHVIHYNASLQMTDPLDISYKDNMQIPCIFTTLHINHNQASPAHEYHMTDPSVLCRWDYTLDHRHCRVCVDDLMWLRCSPGHCPAVCVSVWKLIGINKVCTFYGCFAISSR